jgi:hypothetical protein
MVEWMYMHIAITPTLIALCSNSCPHSYYEAYSMPSQETQKAVWEIQFTSRNYPYFWMGYNSYVSTGRNAVF